MVKSTDFRWIKDGLAARKFLAKDLAKAWGISESSVSRFLAGHEQPDVPLSRAVTLAQMLGITLDEVAKGLGVMGKRAEPEIAVTGETGRMAKLPANTIQLTMLSTDQVRLTLSQDTTPAKAMEVMKVLAIS